MKFAKISLSLILAAASFGIANAQVSSFVSSQIDATARSCSDLAGATAGLPQARAKALAIAALEPCYDALRNLDSFETSNGASLTLDERNYFYYVGGNIIWITAGLEALKNDGRLNENICLQARLASSSWSNVRVPAGSPVDIEMQNNQIRQMLISGCQVG